MVDVPIGGSGKELPSRDPALRKLLEKAIAEETHTDIVWINAGGIRDSLSKGRLMARDIWNILPFDNSLVTGTSWARNCQRRSRTATRGNRTKSIRSGCRISWRRTRRDS
jgi:hypothetical protein